MESTVELNVHPAFLKFIEICNKINFGVIKELKVQNGIPVFIIYDIKTELDATIELSKKLV